MKQSFHETKIPNLVEVIAFNADDIRRYFSEY